MDATSIGYITMEIAIGLVTLVGNSMVLLAIYRNKPLRTPTNCFIGSLALADLLVGISVPPLVALSYVGLPHNFYGCVFINSLVVVLTQISIFGLLAIAIERFIAIKYPFAYHKHVTIYRSILTLIVISILACVVGLVPMFGWNKRNFENKYCAFTNVIGYDYMVYFNFFGFVLTPLLIMFAIYIYIFSIVHQQMVAMEALNITDGSRKRRKFLRDIKAAKSLAMVLVLFAICWLPIHVCNSLSLFCKECTIPLPLLLSAILLSHANSMFNPILYAYGNSKFKRAFRKICYCPVSLEDKESTDYVTQRPQQGTGDNAFESGTACTTNPVTETTKGSTSQIMNGEVEFTDIIQDGHSTTRSEHASNANPHTTVVESADTVPIAEVHGLQQTTANVLASVNVSIPCLEMETVGNSECNNQTSNEDCKSDSQSLPNVIFITHL